MRYNQYAGQDTLTSNALKSTPHTRLFGAAYTAVQTAGAPALHKIADRPAVAGLLLPKLVARPGQHLMHAPHRINALLLSSHPL